MKPVAAPLSPKAAPGAATDDTVQLCCFFVGAQELAVDIMRVEEILQPARVTPVVGAPPFVEGVIDLRGAVIPVVDLRKRLRAQGEPPSHLKPKMLVCLLGRRRIALSVDGVSEVIRVSRSALKPSPAFEPPGREPLVIGVCGPPEAMKLLLDVKALLKNPDGAVGGPEGARRDG